MNTTKELPLNEQMPLHLTLIAIILDGLSQR